MSTVKMPGMCKLMLMGLAARITLVQAQDVKDCDGIQLLGALQMDKHFVGGGYGRDDCRELQILSSDLSMQHGSTLRDI